MKNFSVLKDYLRAFGIAVLVALFLRVFVVQAYQIPTGSMKDTLLIGDFLLVNKYVYGASTPQYILGIDQELPSVRLPRLQRVKRGDVVVFRYPRDPHVAYVKRCVAMPGDLIEIRDNVLYIDGEPEGKKVFVKREFDEREGRMINYFRIVLESGRSYVIREFDNDRHPRASYGPVIVPPKHYFMLGDNRDNSSDSRYWGFLPHENIIGRAMMIYFSWNQFEKSWNVFDRIRWSRLFHPIR